MKKMISIFMSFVLIVTLFSSFVCVASAQELPDNTRLISVEVVPNSIADAAAPEHLRNALLSEENARGISVPSANNKWDLSVSKYTFEVETTGSTIYSDYVFINHGDGVKVSLVAVSETSGKYTFKLFERGIFNTTISTIECWHNDTTVDYFYGLGGEKSKIYFAVIPNGYTNLQSNSYIETMAVN